MAIGDPILILGFAAAVGVAIGLGYRVRQLEERVVQLRGACDGKDIMIIALVSENDRLKNILNHAVIEMVAISPCLGQRH